MVVAIPLFALLGLRAVPIYVALLAAYILPIALYGRSRYNTTLGRIALDAAFVVMSLFFIFNYYQSTVLLGSTDAPFLLHDARSFYMLAHDIYHHTLNAHSPIVPYIGYPLFLSGWLHLGITDIAYPMIFNIFLMLCSMLLVARCVCCVVSNNTAIESISSYAMVMMAFIPGVMCNGMILSKEPFVIVALLMCVCSLYALKERVMIVKYSILLIVGLIILALCRATYIYVLLLFAVGAWTKNITRRDIISFVAVISVIIIFLVGGLYASWWNSSDFVADYVSQDSHTTFFCGESQEPLQQLIGPYNSYSIVQRLLLLPLSIIVQFFIPFPFETAAPEVGLPLSMSIYQRMSYLWYIVALPIIAYYIFYLGRKGGTRTINIWAVVSALAYCIPAFVTAGAISRYAYCFVPFLTIVGAYVIWYVKNNPQEYKKMLACAMIYTLLVTIALYIGANPYYIL